MRFAHTSLVHSFFAWQHARLTVNAVAALVLGLILRTLDMVVGGGSDLVMLGTVGTTGTLDWLLTDFYDNEWVRDGVNNKLKLKPLFEERSSRKEYGGKKVVYPHHTTRNASPFFCAEYGYFAEGDVQGGVDVTVDIRKIMARVGPLTDDVIKDAANSEAAWEGVEENNFSAMVDDIARRQELALCGDGRGVLALINDATPSGAANMAVDSPMGFAGSTFGNRFLSKKFKIGAIDPATGLLRAGVVTVVSVNAAGTEVTFDAAPNAAWADNDYLVKVANTSVTDTIHTEFDKWPLGLMGLFDDGTYKANYGGVDRTVIDNLNSYVQASTGSLSVDGMQVMSDALETRVGGITSIMLAHSSIRRLVIKLTQADRRYADSSLQRPDPGTVAFKQGDITVGEVPVISIRDFPYGVLVGMDVEMAKMRRYVSTDGEWVMNNNGRWFPAGLGSTALDAKEAWYRCRYQNWVKNPAAGWRMDGITGASVTIVRPLGD
jgi:hypothetical protein